MASGSSIKYNNRIIHCLHQSVKIIIDQNTMKNKRKQLSWKVTFNPNPEMAASQTCLTVNRFNKFIDESNIAKCVMQMNK